MQRTTTAPCLPPIHLERVLDDATLVRDLLERNAPYYPVQRYVRNDAEHRAISAQGPMIVAPNFRGDWAYDRPLVDGAEVFFQHEGFAAAARRLFDTEHVRPQQVYVNITWQLPFHQGGGHTDVPAFRGVDRTRYPIWFLNVMGRSGLFEDERIRIATAVAWFFRRDDGGFEYWPDGPDQPPRLHQGDIFNTAIVGDNDRMFHRVMPVGRREDGMLSGMTLATRLEHDHDDRWRIAEDSVLAQPDWEQLRTSVSWKALAFRDRSEERMVDEHSDDLTIEAALERIYADLEARGEAVSRPDRPLEDPDFVELLSATYVREPTPAN